jgi:hypothetical protein
VPLWYYNNAKREREQKSRPQKISKKNEIPS